MTTPPLVGRDAQILHHLAQVIAIGKHRGTWGPADIVRVAVDHLAPRTEQVTPIRRQPRATVEVTAKQLAVFRDVCEGQTRKAVCDRHGIAMGTLNNHLADVSHAMGVRSTTEAVALVLTNQIGVRQKQRKAAA